MNLLPVAFQSLGNSVLRNPGDKITAEITETGKQIIKIHTADIMSTAVRYPGTGTIVETIVRKTK